MLDMLQSSLSLCVQVKYTACLCPYTQERLKSIKKTHGSKELGKVTVDMAIGGMRGITVSTQAQPCSALLKDFGHVTRLAKSNFSCTFFNQLNVVNFTPACFGFTGAAVGDITARSRGGHPVQRVQHP